MAKVLITGGAGFIGANAAAAFLARNDDVIILDNLSRRGSETNLEWIRTHGDIEFIPGDIREEKVVHGIFKSHTNIDVVLHLCGQVAVTHSVERPLEDFEINAKGTLLLLEAIRHQDNPPILIYSSTNKVYGNLESIPLIEKETRYEFGDGRQGIGEDYPLDFHSPYGCSKGAAGQYVHDYARIYGLRTVVLRQSCIYGYRQFGEPDQGWVAWFMIATALGKPLSIYGDGKQVRDVLLVDDLVDAYLRVVEQIDIASGKVYNVGGGPANTLSLLELISLLEKDTGKKIEYEFDDWRPGDQRIFICDISKIHSELGWAPRVSPPEGIRRLRNWIDDNRALFASLT